MRKFALTAGAVLGSIAFTGAGLSITKYTGNSAPVAVTIFALPVASFLLYRYGNKSESLGVLIAFLLISGFAFLIWMGSELH